MIDAPRRDPYRLTGDVFGGRYRLEEFAGAGSYGAVYRATDTRLERTVAVKILKPDIEESSAGDARALFQREALTAGRLMHPNIVAVTDTGEENGFAYLVMEWLEGRTLEDEMRARGDALTPAEVAVLLAPIADALQAAHDAGVVHRDIKPSNIHLGRANRHVVKVLDFGIAKVVASSSSAAAASRIAGTLSYMSPEQLTGGLIDRRADIYSLGIMLYQMLTDAMPFSGESQGQLIQQHIVAPPPPLQRVRPELPHALSRVVERALAKRPADRQQTALQLYQEFAAALESANSMSTMQAPLTDTFAGEKLSTTTMVPAPASAEHLAATAYPPPAPLAPAGAVTADRLVHDKTTTGASPSFTGSGDDALAASAPDDLKDLRLYAFGGAVLLFLLNIVLGLFGRVLGLTGTGYSYDEFVVELITTALRDATFGAALGVVLSEILRPANHWAVGGGRRLARVFIVYGASGVAGLMGLFVVLRTSFFWFALLLAIIGFVAGVVVCGVRLGAQNLDERKR